MVRIDQSPDDAKKVTVSPIIGQPINTLIHKQVICRLIEPDEWFHLSCAATSGVIDPKTLALPHNLEHYADEAIQADSPMPGCPVSTQLGTFAIGLA
jgi:hypothetical protein